ncbi:phage portal protein BeeE [Neomicrococcus aestuarii]|uniref:Phage portal protein BeeE n=1 Tax=Neomicrococcus aestuarii TaxID=556325 RepID=A0A7W8TTI4_9MICC|nr:hypothetical protein [Neomicrococcus aestuarii]MBB5512528.1 phage portal protein BeeE [Neomicrococcus aestuarii]
MPMKDPGRHQTKKVGKTIKEKRAEKRAKANGVGSTPLIETSKAARQRH